MQRWRCSTGCTALPSPAPYTRSGRCWPPAGSPCPASLATLADVFAYAAEGVKLRIDGTEVQVRRPKANRPGRRAFVYGKKKQNTIKATAVSDPDGRLLWLGAFRPGRMHDVTALRTEGAEDLLRRYPTVTPRSRLRSIPATGAWPATSQSRSAPHRRNPPRTLRPNRPPAGNSNVTSSPPSGSAPSRPLPNPGSGGPCSAISDAVTTSKRPRWL